MLKKYIVYFTLLIVLIIFGINILILGYLEEIKSFDELESFQVALVLGAKVYSDHISDVFKDRIDSAIELYKEGKIDKILVSGDHGTREYDEVNTAKEYLLKNNVKEEDIFLDHAGFDTYDSIYRAKEVFGINNVIIVSQNFHLKRALYIADKLDIEAQGFSADLHRYIGQEKNELREILARVKAFIDVNFNAMPKFLGPEININGDGRQTWD
jgi:vancomycin permeability regulator SanA